MNLIWTPAQLAMLAKVVDLNGFSAAVSSSAPRVASSSRRRDVWSIRMPGA